MSEFVTPVHVENHEKIPTGSTLLLAEPVFRTPPGPERTGGSIYMVPKGMEHWAMVFGQMDLSDVQEAEILTREYVSIVRALKQNGVSFRIIVAHRDAVDKEILLRLMLSFNIRGLGLHPSISSTCFPRDMMVDFDGMIFVNPEANFNFPNNSGIESPLGDGGAVISSSNKLFVADPAGYPPRAKMQLERDLARVRGRFQIGFLPHPIGVKINTETGEREEFTSHHPDRVSGKLKGRDGKDYLLVDSTYADQYRYPWGSYYHVIRNTCGQLQTKLVVVERDLRDTPYSLNFEQFEDGSVVMTSGHRKLERIVRDIIGDNTVVVTETPIILYPVRRKGGIRCMTLFAPKKIVGLPILDPKTGVRRDLPFSPSKH